MNLNCLRFPSPAVLKEFINYVHPYVIEQVDTILCGVFTESEMAIAIQRFNATLIRKQQGMPQ